MSDSEAIYVLVCVEITIDANFGNSFSLEPIGVFDDLDTAINYATKLEDIDHKPRNVDISYDVLDFNLNEKPRLLSFLEKTSRTLEDNVTSVLISLMEKGYVDQLVGEDGFFYYQLTSKGQNMAEDMPNIVKHLFRKKRKDNGDTDES